MGRGLLVIVGLVGLVFLVKWLMTSPKVDRFCKRFTNPQPTGGELVKDAESAHKKIDARAKANRAEIVAKTKETDKMNTMLQGEKFAKALQDDKSQEGKSD